ncbi:hypothetical protein MNBD_GAMMA11-824 [hydrothermal vent metagenome]|uniref:PEP-CTERM protein-sorting domain-containing protein n=1 Tax=hydrothermal vent metagenome TaxID=652676 RepID=A0A3B0XNQ8_9ZZZZ
MKNIFLSTALLSALSLAPQAANAALVEGSALNFDGVFLSGNVTAIPAVGNGSWFSMQLAPEPQLPVITSISSFNGLVIGTTQSASSIPTESNIDNPWAFAGPLGVHQSTSNTRIISASGDTATIDFSGWGASWNGIPNINLGTGNSNGIATITCDTGSGCANGAGYVLDYSATLPSNAANYGNVKYKLHLEGTISAVPVPAAVWLFGSGLIGLTGMARRKR